MRDFDLKKFTMEGEPMPKWLSVVGVMFFVLFFAFGVRSLLQVHERFSPSIAAVFDVFSPAIATIASNPALVFVFPVVSVLVGLALTYAMIALMKRYTTFFV